MNRKSTLWTLITVLVILSFAMTGCKKAEDDQVEVFSWWTGGGEAAGLNEMIKIFQEKYPDTEFINAAVAGGAGTNARAVLATRLAGWRSPG